jgi:acetyl esterase/lipase
MSVRTIDLWEGAVMMPDAATEFRPTLDLYLLDAGAPRGAVLICPGGGYANRASYEGHDIALFMNSVGLHACVVQYRVAPNRYPAALNDAARAIRMMRARSGEWGIRPDKIAVCGFSAGGHLAASLSVFHERAAMPPEPDLRGQSARPDASILCYPVISSSPGVTHAGSYANLLGDHSQEAADRQSPEKHVDRNTPPAFLWHTFADKGVDMENCLSYARALRREDVPFELHVFPQGAHGTGLATAISGTAAWPGLCRTWLADQEFMAG